MAEKKSKSEVNYRHGNPKERCGICTMFLMRTNECTAVKGLIMPAKLCDLFKKAKS